MPREISLYYFLLVYKILRDNGHLYLMVFLTVQAICIQKQTQLHLPQVFQIKVAQLRSALTLGQKTNIIQHSEKTSKATQEGEKSSAKFVFFFYYFALVKSILSVMCRYMLLTTTGGDASSARHPSGMRLEFRILHAILQLLPRPRHSTKHSLNSFLYSFIFIDLKKTKYVNLHIILYAINKQ